MASKILKNAEDKNYATGGVLSSKHVIVEPERGERVIPYIMSDSDIERILQARLKAIESKQVFNMKLKAEELIDLLKEVDGSLSQDNTERIIRTLNVINEDIKEINQHLLTIELRLTDLTMRRAEEYENTQTGGTSVS